MTDLAPLRKVFILCAAVTTAVALTACDGSNLKESLARLKEVPVDGSRKPADADAKSISREDVELVVNTAKDIAVGEGGLLRKSADADTASSITIAVVDPLKMPSVDNAPLDTGTDDLPAHRPATVVAAQAPIRQQMPVSASARLIQVGSFGTTDAAENAWQGLLARYPGVDRYQPTYQKITTASGKPMVRLKVGPVADDGQAKSLCRQLDIRDAWCAKAG